MFLAILRQPLDSLRILIFVAMLGDLCAFRDGSRVNGYAALVFFVAALQQLRAALAMPRSNPRHAHRHHNRVFPSDN